MIKIKIKDKQLLDQILIFKDQLKVEVKNENVEIIDQSRNDLFTELGISRQIAIFHNQYQIGSVAKEKSTTLALNLETAKNYFGISVSEKNIIESLKKFGYRIVSKKDGKLILKIPLFRGDVTTEGDILEDIMLFNLKKFKASKEFAVRVICQNQEDISERIVARRLVSFGFKELNLPLHEKIEERSFGQEHLFRSSLLPSLIQYEMDQQHLKYPHKLFEIGSIIDRKNKNLCLIISGKKADFNEVFSIIDILFAKNGLSLSAQKTMFYEEGASFEIIFNKIKIGTIGILSKEYKAKFNIKETCVCAELELDD